MYMAFNFHAKQRHIVLGSKKPHWSLPPCTSQKLKKLMHAWQSVLTASQHGRFLTVLSCLAAEGNTQVDLRAILEHPDQKTRTIVPQEVKLENQVRIPAEKHYVDMVQTRLEDVKRPLAQLFMYMVRFVYLLII